MKTSQDGIELLKRFEGLELESYPDIAGIWTIGYGHTGSEVAADQKLTEQEAIDLLRKDLVPREKAINDLVRVPLNQYQFDALVSFVYNIGIGAFKRSTAMRLLNKGDYEDAAAAMLMFDKATVNGVFGPVTGLTNRRKAEKALFLKPVPIVETNNQLNADYIADHDTRITPLLVTPWWRLALAFIGIPI